jgi:hypothetical protein
MNGYIKIYRKILDNPIVCKDSDYFAVWMYLLLNATHKEYDTIFKGKRITLKKGQLIVGRISLSNQFSTSESKVQRILKTFENEQQIEQQTCNKNRLITITNWELYQDIEQQNEQQVNNKRTTSEQQVNTNKNDKNVKNVINNIKEIKRKKYGEYQKVLLSEEEYQKLLTEYGDNLTNILITYLDEYIEMKGYKAKNHYLCIKKWVLKAVQDKHLDMKQKIPNCMQDIKKEEIELTDEQRRELEEIEAKIRG